MLMMTEYNSTSIVPVMRVPTFENAFSIVLRGDQLVLGVGVGDGCVGSGILNDTEIVLIVASEERDLT